MNARFPDQFRAAIEVHEIGNPSENDIVRLSVHTLYITRNLYVSPLSFSLFLSVRMNEKREDRTKKHSANAECGGERKRRGSQDKTLVFPS